MKGVPNLQLLATIGLLAGLSQVFTGIALYSAGAYFAPWSMLVSLGVLLLCILVGVRLYATSTGLQPFRYKHAFLVGVAVSIATAVLYALYNVVSIRFFYADFLDQVAREWSQQAAAGHGSQPRFETLRRGLTPERLAVSNLLRLAVFGTVLSAISAIFLRVPAAGSGSEGHRAA